MKMELSVIASIALIICAAFSAFIASQKNRETTSWFALGILFNLFALIAIAAVPKLGQKPKPDDQFAGAIMSGLLVITIAALTIMVNRYYS
jgi:hypothetical protein